MTDRKSLDAAAGKDKTKLKASSSSAAPSSKDARDQNTNGAATKTSPKKRRKVNHACVYCRRSVSSLPSRRRGTFLLTSSQHMTCDLVRFLLLLRSCGAVY